MRGGKQVNSRGAEEGFEALSKYARDLTAEAEQGKLDPVIGRDNEIRRCIRILSRRSKNNPVVIGDPVSFFHSSLCGTVVLTPCVTGRGQDGHR